MRAIDNRWISWGWFLIVAAACALVLAGYSPCHAFTVELRWDPNPETTLAGYKVYYKADSSSLPYDGSDAVEGHSPVDVLNVTTTRINGLDPTRTYYFAITAYDSSGIESPYSDPIVLEAISPAVSISYPAGNSTISGLVVVTAEATDNMGVERVEFYVDDVLQATDSSSPYQFSWNTISSVGSHSIIARAIDISGNLAQSAAIPVTVAAEPTLQRTLTTAFSGNGSGSLNSSPSGIACISGTCSSQFDDGTLVTLIASPVDSPESLSYFSGWSGDCASTSGMDCMVNMVDERQVTAVFTMDPPVRVHGGDFHSSLQSAYAVSGSDGIIDVQAVVLTGDFAADSSRDVILDGGYDATYSGNEGFTEIQGTLSVIQGSLTVNNLVIR
jgi:hypothetical protein